MLEIPAKYIQNALSRRTSLKGNFAPEHNLDYIMRERCACLHAAGVCTPLGRWQQSHFYGSLSRKKTGEAKGRHTAGVLQEKEK